jgi:hypothetical protein
VSRTLRAFVSRARSGENPAQHAAGPFVTRSSPTKLGRLVRILQTSRMSRGFAASLGIALAGVALGAPSAHANGAFPEVSQLVADPADPAHLVLRSNFGLLTSSDAGLAWDLVCEAGIGYQNIEPPIAVLGNGTLIAALPTGIAHGAANACEFGLAAGVTAYVADVARVPGTPAQAVAVSVDFDRNTSQVWRTTDAGASWRAWGAELEELNAATLEVASTDASLLYVSGVSQSGVVSGVLARSTDGGQSWARFDVPGASKVSAPYIAAVAAQDSDTVYVRLSGTPGHLLVTHDGGQQLTPLLDFTGPFDGFALSPDGQYALASGRTDGVWRAPTASLVFEQLSCTHLRCLSWTNAGLFACACSLAPTSFRPASWWHSRQISVFRSNRVCTSRVCVGHWPAPTAAPWPRPATPRGR